MFYNFVQETGFRWYVIYCCADVELRAYNVLQIMIAQQQRTQFNHIWCQMKSVIDNISQPWYD